MEWIKELLKGFVAEDKMNEVIDAYKKEFPKHAVPKDDFNKVKKDLKDTDAELATTKAKMDELNAALKDDNKDATIEELKTKLSDATKAFDDFKADTEKRETTRTKADAYKKLLAANGANPAAIDLLAGAANLDDVTLDKAGNIVDGDDLVASVKKDREALFNSENISGNNDGSGGSGGTDGGSGDGDRKILSVEEVYKQKNLTPFNQMR